MANFDTNYSHPPLAESDARPHNGDGLETAYTEEADPFIPRFAQSLDQLDINLGCLADLALKAVSLDPGCTTASVAERIHLGMLITDTLLQRLSKEKLVETTGTIALHNNRYAMLERGWAHVAQQMALCSYVGPAPVSLESYTEMITSQVRSRRPVTRETMDHILQGLVLPTSIKRRLGVVATSGRSLFLSGPPGNGKTVMARALVDAIAGGVWIPYAIEVDGQVIRVFDKHCHHLLPELGGEYDRRWVRIRPPLVVVGGELTIQSLDLSSTETPRCYEAPFQVKANGGVLVVDDLGRQRVSARELLNRWIVPLENRVDYLTLSTGKKIQVPFELTVVFATNLRHADIVDEAFLRRMGYRLYVSPPSADTYAEIFQLTAEAFGLTINDDQIRQLVARYDAEGREMTCCHPRDLLLRVMDLCKFDGQNLHLTPEILDEAWESYFGGDRFTQLK